MAEPSTTSTALAHAEPRGRAVAHREEFTREQIELIKRTVAPGVSDDELSLFLEVSRRRGLDPFNGQIHAIMRFDSQASRKVMKIQTGIDGYRAIADRTGVVEWVDGPEWTADGETWVRVWLEDDPPKAARFTVKRKDRGRPEQRVATWREYRQTNNKGELTRAWKEMSATMLGKVAEAATLRAALPETLGGLYTTDEMDQSYTPPAELEAGASSDDGPVELVDHAEERAELFDRYGKAYARIRDVAGEDAAKAAHGKVKGRLRGKTVPDAFNATAMHVLAEIVESIEADAAELAPDDGGDDDDPARAGFEQAMDRADDEAEQTSGDVEEPEAAEPADRLETVEDPDAPRAPMGRDDYEQLHAREVVARMRDGRLDPEFVLGREAARAGRPRPSVRAAAHAIAAQRAKQATHGEPKVDAAQTASDGSSEAEAPESAHTTGEQASGQEEQPAPQDEPVPSEPPGTDDDPAVREELRGRYRRAYRTLYDADRGQAGELHAHAVRLHLAEPEGWATVPLVHVVALTRDAIQRAAALEAGPADGAGEQPTLAEGLGYGDG